VIKTKKLKTKKKIQKMRNPVANCFDGPRIYIPYSISKHYKIWNTILFVLFFLVDDSISGIDFVDSEKLKPRT
jgi:hypothetical protein